MRRARKTRVFDTSFGAKLKNEGSVKGFLRTPKK